MLNAWMAWDMSMRNKLELAFVSLNLDLQGCLRGSASLQPAVYPLRRCKQWLDLGCPAL